MSPHSDFARDGAVVVRGALTPAQVAVAAAGIEAVLADPSPLALTASSPGDPGHFVEDFRNWQRIAPIGELALDAGLGELAATLMGSPTARLYHDHVLVKEPGTLQRTPWHQDLPYFNVAGAQNVSFWIPVDPVPVEGSLEFVAGSHLGPWCTPRAFMDQAAKWFPEGELAELPDIDAARATGSDEFRILSWPLEPGDLVAFHMLTIHGAAGFAGPGRRRVLSLRYLGEDMRHAPRPWRTSPPFPELLDDDDDDADHTHSHPHSLPAGAPMDHPLFPIVFPAS
ncbi:MAG: phytanoyl-CoA dioxygenase family protein [Acidimicrobiales bacterium]